MSEFRKLKLKNRLELLRSQLEIERSSFDPHYADLGDFVSPRSVRFFITDTNKGDPRSENIIDSTATMALRIMEAGMMTRLTSPARPWFKIDREIKEKVKTSASIEWTAEVTKGMRTVFLKSNLYTNLPMLYKSTGLYGTGCMYMEEDFETVVRFRTFPTGSYFLGNDAKLRVRVFMRGFQMTTRQIVEKFGQDANNPRNINWENISTSVKSQYESGNMEQWNGVVHFIIPNHNYNPNRLQSKFKKYLSVYYERGTGQGARGGLDSGSSINEDKILQEKGYDFFPILAARWSKESEDVYGTDCPGMIALGDIKQLQHGEKSTARAIDKEIDPPLKGPISLKKAVVSTIPGEITYVDEGTARQGLSSIYNVKFDISKMESKQAQVRDRINKAFFVDLFLMLTNMDRRNITATEIDARGEEQLLVLGPVLERYNDDVFDPLIDNTFDIMLRQGLIPDPPPEMEGENLKIEYISIMAQAQKVAGIGSIERYSAFVGQLAGINQNVVHKLDTDSAADEYAELVGAPQSIVRDSEEAGKIRDALAERAAEEEERTRVADSIEAAKGLSQANTEKGNALSELLASGEGVI